MTNGCDEALSLEDLVDLNRYPLHDRQGSAYDALVAEKRAAWRAMGICTLPGLLRVEAAARAAAELREPMDRLSFRHVSDHNIFFSDEVDGLPPDLAAPQLRTSHRTLTCDQMRGSIIRRVYEWDPLRAFIQDVLEAPHLHRMADPMACLNVMSYAEGDGLSWHFDRASFAVTILLQPAEEGGQFEYRRNLRGPGRADFEGIRRLLDGRDDQVQRSAGTAGTMTLFAGFGSAHRVAPIGRGKARVMAVLGYMQEPGYHFSEAERLRFYGRAVPEAPVQGQVP